MSAGHNLCCLVIRTATVQPALLRTSALLGFTQQETTVTQIYGPRGEVISSGKGVKKALAGELVAEWGGAARSGTRTPTQINLGYDTSKLRIEDYRLMREHHQISSSLSVLSFMMFQRTWRINCDSAKIGKHATENLKMLWPRIIRAMSGAFWSGYAPCALQWENDLPDGKMWITKIKDLMPEDCEPRWRYINGVAEKKEGMAHSIPSKVPVYNGIRQFGNPDIPVDNSFWYPLLMENGNYFGRKLLNAAFRPWYFSMLMHLYANRYMERFAEPTPVGRAPFDDVIKIGDKEWSGNKLMQSMLAMHKNGSALVLPNSRTPDGLNSNESTYDYIVEYLESQLRGVEFDRVIQMYDEEISLALFTPLLLTRGTDAGSSNLGVVHVQTYMQMLNAIGGDWEEYLNRYILRPMAIQNFGKNAKLPTIEFRPLGRTDAETVRGIVTSMIGRGTLGVDLEELGDAAGLTFHEIEQVLPDPEAAPDAVLKPGQQTPGKDPRIGRPGKNVTPKGTDKVKKAAEKIAARVNDQATKAYRGGHVADFEPDLGYRRQFVDALVDAGVDEFDGGEAYAIAQRRCDLAARDAGQFSSPDEFVALVEGIVIAAAEEIIHAS